MTAGKPRTRAFRITRGLAVEMMYVFSMAELLSFMAKLVHGQIRASTRYNCSLFWTRTRFSPYTLPKKVIRCALTPFFWKGIYTKHYRIKFRAVETLEMNGAKITIL